MALGDRKSHDLVFTFLSPVGPGGAGSFRNIQIDRSTLGNVEFGPFALGGAWLRGGCRSQGSPSPQSALIQLGCGVMVQRQGWEQAAEQAEMAFPGIRTGGFLPSVVGEQSHKARLC